MIIINLVANIAPLQMVLVSFLLSFQNVSQYTFQAVTL